jgi:N,N'-diacetyllegionaminate synthase
LFIIAELAQAHEGSLGIAHSYIDALAETGIDAIKFQTHIAEAESSIHEPFRINFSYEDERRIDYWKRMEFTPEQWKGLKDHCEEKGMEFLSSPFSNAAVEMLDKLDVKRFKIGSGEINNFLMLEKIAKTGKPMILSSGMSSFGELDKTISFLRNYNNPLFLLQCTTAYPSSPDEWGLNVISELKERYNDIPVGFSDHSGDIYACLAAAALGAEILEFHVVFDKRMFGPDSKASLTIDQINQLMEGVRQITTATKNPVNKHSNEKFSELKQIFEKSLAVNRDMDEGEIIDLSVLEAKKPKGFGIDAMNYRDIIGKRLKKKKKKWDFLNFSDF